MKKALKTFFTLLFCTGFVCAFGEAESFFLQLLVSGGSMLTMWVSYQGLKRLNAFNS